MDSSDKIKDIERKTKELADTIEEHLNILSKHNKKFKTNCGEMFNVSLKIANDGDIKLLLDGKCVVRINKLGWISTYNDYVDSGYINAGDINFDAINMLHKSISKGMDEE